MSKPESYDFPKPPVECQFTEEVDLCLTNLLNKFVEQQQMVETPEQL